MFSRMFRNLFATEGESPGCGVDRMLELGMERLEGRQMLAGNVAVQVTGAGDLRIRGDNNSNHIQMRPQGALLRIEGRDGTTVNGQNVLLVSGVQDDIFVHLRNGNNVIQTRGISVAGDFKIRSGRGNDTAIILETRVFEDLEIFTGGGDDIVGVGTPDIREDLIVKTAAGDDSVLWESGQVSVDAVFILGSGDDQIEFGEDLRLLDELDIRGGGGNDFVGLGPDDVDLFGSTEILLGGGDDTLVLDEPNFFGPIRLLGNGGRGDQLFRNPAVNVPGTPAQFEFETITNNTDDIIRNEFAPLLDEILDRVGAIIA